MTEISCAKWRVIGAFALIYIVWGSTYLALAVTVASIPPFLLMGTRSLIGGMALVFAAHLATPSYCSIADWARAAVCGFLFFVTCHGVLALAQQHVPSGIAALLLATIPFWISLIDAVLPGGNRPSARQFLLLIPGFAGVALVVMSRKNAGFSDVGDLFLLLGAAMSWALGTVLSRRWSPPSISLEFSGMELIGGGSVLLLIAAFRGETDMCDWHALSLTALCGWLYLTILGTVITFTAYIWLLKRVSSKLVATYAFVNPVIAVFLGWAFLNEMLSGPVVAGAALVVGSVIGLLFSARPQTDGTSNIRNHQSMEMRQ